MSKTEPMRIPHENLLRIEKDGHEVSDSEREAFAALHVKVVQDKAAKMLKICYPFLVVVAFVLCILLDKVEGGYPLAKTVPTAVIGCVGMAVFMVVMFAVGKVNIRRQGQFTYVKQAVFQSFSPEENRFTVFVYEWVDGEIRLCEYPDEKDLLSGAKYGDVVYRFTDKKGRYIMQKK